MSSYGYAGYGYGGYGYGYGYGGGYGYAEQIGPAYFKVDFLQGYLDGPGSGGYYDSGRGLTGSIYENAYGGITQQVDTTQGGYDEHATSYSYANGAYSVRTYAETVSDPGGLRFDTVGGQPLSATSGYFYRSVVTAYGASADSVTTTTYGVAYYDNGSYRAYEAMSSYGRGVYGGISGTGSSSYAASYDAATGYVTTYHSP